MLGDLFRKALRVEPVTAQPVAIGLHHYYRELDGETVRYHLRVDADGSGILLCNARAACRLSPSGIMAAQSLLAGDSRGMTLARLRRSFHGVGSATLRADVKRVRDVIFDLASGRGAYPIQDLDHPDGTLQRRTLAAPLAAELTVGEDEGKGALELLRPLWEGGVPQVVFDACGVESEKGLVQLVEHGEDLGLITGVRAAGSLLGEGSLVQDLAAAGVDHLDVLFAGEDAHPELWGLDDFESARSVLERARKAEVCPVAVVPLVYGTLEHFGAIARELRELRVGSVIAYALAQPDGSPATRDGSVAASGLRQLATSASEHADRYDLDLLWAPPVERLPDVELVEQLWRGPRVSGEGRIRVAADGRVLPPVGPVESVGRLGRDSLAKIWAHERFRSYREAADDPPRCVTCPRLVLCAAGCPVETDTWSLGGVG